MHSIAQRCKGICSRFWQKMTVGKTLKPQSLSSRYESSLRTEYRNLGRCHSYQSGCASHPFDAKPGWSKLQNVPPQISHLSVAVPLELPQGWRKFSQAINPFRSNE